MNAPTLTRPEPLLAAEPVTEHAPPTARAGFRADIQGLRAVAVLLVVLFHAGVPGLAGGYVGVDVFFVISGFLITGLIRAEITRTGRLRFGRFYARRARRLLPSAAVVIIATLLLAWVWGPALQLKTTAIDAVFTAFYAVNFRLAARGVDYQNAGGPESPLQHFWSLAVEEQFYLVWPVLLLIAAVVFRRHRGAGSIVVIGAATAGSLWYSVYLTHVAAPTAYFSVFTRGWEFGVGALVALAATAVARVPAAVRNAAAWAGLVAIVASAVLFDAATPFPGDAALVPVLGAAAVLTGAPGRAGTAALLGRRPFQVVGTLSYGWYLWHWPLLLLVPAAFGDHFGWLRNLEVCFLALWLAGVTYLLLETLARKPLIRPGRWLVKGALLSGVAAALAIVVAVAFSNVPLSGRPATPLASAPVGDASLTAALAASVAATAVPSNLTPTLARAANDRPDTTFDGCYLDYLQTRNLPCVSGDASATRTVVLFGDSHAQQWQAALEQMADAQHFRLVSWTKSACPVAEISVVNETLQRTYSECDAWRTATVTAIQAMRPALVVLSQSETVPPQTLAASTWALATANTARQFTSAGSRVAYIADIPTPPTDVPSCLADNASRPAACAFPRAQAYQAGGDHTDKHRTTASVLSNVGVQVIDPINWICSSEVCPPFVANELVYRDSRHLTNTYVTALGPLLNRTLRLT